MGALLLNVGAQDGGVFLSWSPEGPEARYQVRWRSGLGNWHRQDVGTRNRFAVEDLENGRRYEFQVATGPEQELISSVVAATPRREPDCAQLNYTPAPSPLHFFCSQAALETYLAASQTEPGSLRCRGSVVTHWRTPVPDCLYRTASGEQLLLLRLAGRSFTLPADYPHPEAVRRHALRALWADEVLPASAADAEWIPLPQAITGRVKGHAVAKSYRIAQAAGLSTTVTWFTPRATTTHPAVPRAAIYHEGHGGAAVEIGAETIEWLLERGWTVIAMDMPLIGSNSGDRRPGLAAHADFAAQDDGRVSPLTHFLMPVKSVVDRLIAEAATGDPLVLALGRSGGGWTAYTYGALDPRVDLVVSAAGGRPLSSRLDAPWGAAELGDFEQTAPHFYGRVGHEHLMLAAGTKGALYIFNQWDACCFRVTRDDPFVRYVNGASGPLAKPIRAYVDLQHGGHSIGPAGYAELERFLSGSSLTR